MAWTALFKAELQALARSWVLRGWIIALVLTEFVLLTMAQSRGRIAATPASEVLAPCLILFLYVWSLVIIVLGAGAVSMEADVITDSILSRACTRTQFLSAKFASRALTVLAVYLLAAAAPACWAWRSATNDMTLTTLATGVGIVGLAVLLLLTLGITLSTLCNNTVTAVVLMAMIWYVAPPIFNFLGAGYLSPSSLAQNLPRMLKDPNAPQVVGCAATPTSLAVTFSKDLDPNRAQDPASYQIEGPGGESYTASSAVYDSSRKAVLLGGLSLPAGDKLKVTVHNVTDAGGSEISPAADTAEAIAPKGSSKTASAKTDSGKSSASHATSGAASTSSSVADSALVGGSGKPLLLATEPSSTPVAAGTSSALPSTTPPANGHSTASASTKPSAGHSTASTSTPSAHSASRRKAAGAGTPGVTGCEATASSLKVTFSMDMDPEDVETTSNYIVESPLGKTHAPVTAIYSPGTHAALLSGFSFSTDDPVKVTVRHMHDADGDEIEAPRSSAVYTAVTNWKYVLGLGIPTLLAFGISLLWFSWRDL